jgi:hypothetical protein
VKATKKNAQSMGALSSELLDVKLVTVSDGSKDVTILLLAEKRSRTKGDSKARRARKKLGLSATGNAGTRHEEDVGRLDFRVEVKSGAQVGPIATRFNQARLQSEASKSLGDIRPFAMIAMPDGSSDGIVLMTLDEFAELVSLIS